MAAEACIEGPPAGEDTCLVSVKPPSLALLYGTSDSQRMGDNFPRSPEEIFEDYASRRSGLLRALTDEVDDFYQQCDPERENLCLYGERSGGWTVDLPAEEVPPELPEPCLGVNFARDGMARKDWLALVAVHSDAWLMAVAFFYAVKLDANGRAKLFKLINQFPTLFEVVTGRTAGGTRNSSKPGGVSNNTGRNALPAKRKDTPSQARSDGLPETAGGAPQPSPQGRRLTNEMISGDMVGRMGELFWPDDAMWYLVKIEKIDLKARTAQMVYVPTGEQENCELDEIIRDGHLMVLP